MTLLSTRYAAAKNWSQRLGVARDILAEVRAEASGVPEVQVTVEARPLLLPESSIVPESPSVSDVPKLARAVPLEAQAKLF